MKIVHYPDEGLLKPTQMVTVFDEKLKYLINKMFKVMEKEKGIGLAANQVGLDKSIFIIKIPFIEQELIKIFINPKLFLSGEMTAINEGCLSFPNINVEVPRSSICHVFYQDVNGMMHEEIFTGIPSIVCQHEMDHLEGKTFIDNLPYLTRQQIRDKLVSNEEEKL